MDNPSLPLWGVDVFATRPFAGVRALIVEEAGQLTATQQTQVADALAPLPVGLVQTTAETVEIVDSHHGGGHPEQLLFAALAATDVDPTTVVSPGGQFQVTPVSETPGLTLEPPTATVTTLEGDLDAAVAGATQGHLPIGDEELPPAVVTLHHRWLVVPLAYFSDLSAVDPAAATDLCAQHDAVGLCVLTFDTVDAATTVHMRSVSTAEAAGLVTAAGAVGVYLRRYGAVDDSTVSVAAGLETPPQRLTLALDTPVAVAGPNTTFLTGAIAVPGDDDTVFIEA